MIRPSKHISAEQCLLGVGAVLLQALDSARTTTALWERVRTQNSVGSFERFVLALDMLYIAGLVALHDGLITRTNT